MDAIRYPLKPSLTCSVIMKGGITSGVVYPRLVSRLAETYRLTSIGGSSAGAIAAGVAAAAELRRSRGSEEGFAALENLPETLTETVDGTNSRLLSLFQPQQATKPIFDALMAGLNAKAATDSPKKPLLLERIVMRVMSRRQRMEARTEPSASEQVPSPGGSAVRTGFAALQSLLHSYERSAGTKAPWWSTVIPIVLVILGALTVWLAWPWGLLGGIPLVLLGVISAAMLSMAATVMRLVRGVSRCLVDAVPANGLGLCSGLETDSTDCEVRPALTRWLHDYLQQTAGQDAAHPVTFGDLEDAGVNLRMMTTNLTQGRPMAMPWAEGDFFFDKAAWQGLFPSDVVDWLVNPTPSEHDTPSSDREFQALCSFAKIKEIYPLPQYRDLPIVVAVRMSLSFPVLVSAVPLKAVDWSLTANQNFRDTLRAWLKDPAVNPADAPHSGSVTAPTFDTNWFTDGGLCANLPVHFFDRALATEPTFAVNLQQVTAVEDDATPEGALHNSYLPQLNNEGLGRTWTVWEREADGTPGGPTLAKFATALTSTSMGWVDNEALRMPGYRDRIVTIYNTKDEGGMNLNMARTTVTGLAARGRNAASQLVHKFTDPFPQAPAPTNGFDNHRWIRLRAAVAGLSEWLDEFSEDLAAAAPGAEPLKRFLDGSIRPPSFSRKATALKGFADALDELISRLQSSPVGPNPTEQVTDDSPHPRGRLRLVPYDRAPHRPRVEGRP
jgi:predicted acylesterase/phospholipase RssA